MSSSERLRDNHGRFLPAANATVQESLSADQAVDEVTRTLDELNRVATENFKLQEQLAQIDLMVDTRGWNPLYEYDRDGGMSLRQIKLASNQLRELLAANPLVKRGSQVRNLYVWAGGLEVTAQRASGKSGPLTATIDKLMESPAWQRYIFQPDATEALERACFTDGNVFILGDDRTKKVQRIPLAEITADYRNPDNREEIWAYRRQWTRQAGGDNPTYQVRWYFTDIYDQKRPPSIDVDGTKEAVDTRSTLIDLGVNRQVGWAYGIPDSLAILAWAKLYKEFLVNGYVMSRALAQFAYKVTVATKKAGDSAAMSVARPGDSGSTYIAGSGNDLAPLANAGKGYDFAAGAPLAAIVAAGLDISASELLDSAATDNVQEFSAPGRGMADLRRKTWNSFFKRLLSWAGESKKVRLQWTDLSDAQVQRALQAWTLANNTGYFATDIIQRGMADVLQIADPGPVPDGALLPNNSASAQRADLDPNLDIAPGAEAPGGTKDDPGTTGAAGATAGSGQGQGKSTKKRSAGTSAGSLGNDHGIDK